MKWLKARWSSAMAWIWSYTKWGFLILIAAGVIFVLWDIPKRQVRNLRQTDISGLDTKDRIQFEKDVIAAENSARVTLAQILGGFGLLVGLYLTYRNIKVAHKNVEVAEQGKLTERFSKAVELLGSENLDVRLGGIYALERIARDSQKDHWTVMEVLTAFIREQSRKGYKKYILSSADFSPSLEPMEADFTLSEDIHAALTVIGRRKRVEQERKYYNRIDLSKSFLGKAVLFEANLSGVTFFWTNFTNAILFKSDLGGADLTRAILIHTNLGFTNLSDARLDGTYLHKADLSLSIGLTWEQISEAIIDETTKLPPELEERRKAEQLKKTG